MASSANVTLGSKGTIPYLDPDFILTYADIKLVSSEGHTLTMDRTVLAAASKLLSGLLLEHQELEDAVVFTEVPTNHLGLLGQFVTTGTIPVDAWDSESAASFTNLGVSLSELKMETVASDSLSFYHNDSFINRLKVVKKEEIEEVDRERPRNGKVKPEEVLETELYFPATDELRIMEEDLKSLTDEDDVIEPPPRRKGKTKLKAKREKVVSRNPTKASPVDNVWNCNICDHKFSSRVDLKAHCEESHAGVPLACHICNAQFPSMQFGRLKTHIRKIHEAPPKAEEESYVCVCCGLICEKRKIYTEHLRTQGEYHNNTCPQCPGLEFKTWPEHKDHVEKVHEGHFVSRCKHCPEYFHSGLLARKHMREAHPTMKVTANIPKEMCVECGKLMLKTNMKEHMDREHGTVEHPCDQCPKVCYSKWQLKKHKSHHDKTYPCPDCGKKMTKEWLKKHIMVNHTPDHLKPLQCTYCPKGFAFSKDLKAHMNTHTGEKPFKCEICNAAFAHPANHRAHMRAHRGIKRKK